MTTLKRWATITTSLSLVFGLSACGGQSYRANTTTGVSNNNSNTSASTSSSSTGTVSDADEDSTTENFLPSAAFDFEMTGENGEDPTFTIINIKTDNLLKVKVTAGAAGNLTLSNGYSNFTSTYKCIKYKVTMNGISKWTKTLAVDGGDQFLCPDAADNDVLDFSAYMTQGHGLSKVSIVEARYDFKCQYCENLNYCPFGQIWSYTSSTSTWSCPLTPVYYTHTVTGTVEIQVNGTTL